MNIETLRKFGERGPAAQKAVDELIKRLRKCPYCGNAFLPQTHNHKYCSYECRSGNAAERRQIYNAKIT
jgi:hypothetical protein